jgi:riboflavin synthase
VFTGLIEEIGTIENLKKSDNQYTVKINCSKVLKDSKIGDSIALNGMCVTIIEKGSNYFKADLTLESIARSSIKYSNVGDEVNLERALKLSDRLDGHIVNGHIDGIARIKEIKNQKNSYSYFFICDNLLSKYIVEKGSVSIDGTSLTVAYTHDNIFSVALIPLTLEKTILKNKKAGDIVNIECDILGKYVEKLFLNRNDKKSNISMKFLSENGFL